MLQFKKNKLNFSYIKLKKNNLNENSFVNIRIHSFLFLLKFDAIIVHFLNLWLIWVKTSEKRISIVESMYTI